MSLEIKPLPTELWKKIIDYLDLKNLINVSSVNHVINQIVIEKLLHIKSYCHFGLENDIGKFLNFFKKLQDAYVVKYHYNNQPSRNIDRIGKYILFDYSPCFKNFKFKKYPSQLLKYNEILIVPIFFETIKGAITIENNPLEDYLKIELEKDERLVVEDRMVIRKIAYNFTSLDPCLEIALSFAVSRINAEYDSINESWATVIFKTISNLFSKN